MNLFVSERGAGRVPTIRIGPGTKTSCTAERESPIQNHFLSNIFDLIFAHLSIEKFLQCCKLVAICRQIKSAFS
jgi:hypothetical protein